MDDDIPEALREQSPLVRGDRAKRQLSRFGAFGLVILVGLGLVWFLLRWFGDRGTLPVEMATAPPSPVVTAPSPSPDSLLGHLAYKEAPAGDLQRITPDGRIKLRTAAAQKFKAMVAAAQAQGVSLLPLSGYRSLQDQNYLFFDVKAERGQVPAERAQVSAPPGYSEHHTGYAIDLGDGDQPGTNLQTRFEQTRAFRWLKNNAAYFSFELSFPLHNSQGVSYEPWHWRFVGDQDSLKTFYEARQLAKPNLKSSATP